MIDEEAEVEKEMNIQPRHNGREDHLNQVSNEFKKMKPGTRKKLLIAAFAWLAVIAVSMLVIAFSTLIFALGSLLGG